MPIKTQAKESIRDIIILMSIVFVAIAASMASASVLVGTTEFRPQLVHIIVPKKLPPLVVKTVKLPDFKHDYVIPPVVGQIPPVVTNFQTNDPVVFLTIDDGEYKDPSVVKLLQDNNIKASLFLAQTFIISNPGFFKGITSHGSLIEDHTLSHDINMVRDMSYTQQKAQICGMADYEQTEYGRRPIFYRPPGGAYSLTMLQAAGACGMRAVVTWIAKANGGSMQYQIGNKLRPGDVVLMHFRPEFSQDLQAFVNAEKAAGLHTELLEDWVN
jgi:peptidoglycan/xylan/chitin deacetylase (PgdA/CDA1 family)